MRHCDQLKTGVTTLRDCNAIILFSTVALQSRQFFRRTRSRMESIYFINLISIFAVNVFFFFSGICLNSLVILSFWRSVQLRKKLCHFMIMVLSCCDLLAVLTNSPLMALTAMLRLTGKLDGNARWPHISLISNKISRRVFTPPPPPF